jgi:hypothetical protein
LEAFQKDGKAGLEGHTNETTAAMNKRAAKKKLKAENQKKKKA